MFTDYGVCVPSCGTLARWSVSLSLSFSMQMIICSCWNEWMCFLSGNNALKKKKKSPTNWICIFTNPVVNMFWAIKLKKLTFLIVFSCSCLTCSPQSGVHWYWLESFGRNISSAAVNTRTQEMTDSATLNMLPFLSLSLQWLPAAAAMAGCFWSRERAATLWTLRRLEMCASSWRASWRVKHKSRWPMIRRWKHAGETTVLCLRVNL